MNPNVTIVCLLIIGPTFIALGLLNWFNNRRRLEEARKQLQDLEPPLYEQEHVRERVEMEMSEAEKYMNERFEQVQEAPISEIVQKDSDQVAAEMNHMSEEEVRFFSQDLPTETVSGPGDMYAPAEKTADDDTSETLGEHVLKPVRMVTKSKVVYKSAITGKFVSKEYARAHPATTFRQGVIAINGPHKPKTAAE